MQAEVKIKASFKTTEDNKLVQNAKKQGEKAGQAFNKSASKGISDLGNGLKLLQGQAGALAKSLASVFSGGWIAAAGVAVAALGAKLNQIWEKLKYTTQQDRIKEADKQKQESIKRNEALKEQIKTTENYFQRLVQLSQKESLNNIQKMEAITLIQSLTKDYGDLGIRMDETTGTIYGMISAYEQLRKVLGKRKQKALDDIVEKSKKEIAENSTFKQMNKNANQTHVTYTYYDEEGNPMTTTRKKTAQEIARDQQWKSSTQGKIDILQKQRDSLPADSERQFILDRKKALDQLIAKLKQLQTAEAKSAFFKKTGFETRDDLIKYLWNVNRQLEKSADELAQMQRKAEANKTKKTFDLTKSFVGDQGKNTAIGLQFSQIESAIQSNNDLIYDAKSDYYTLNLEYDKQRKIAIDVKKTQIERLQALTKLKEIQAKMAQNVKLQHKYEKQNVELSLRKQDLQLEKARIAMAERQKRFNQLTPAEEKVKFLNKEATDMQSQTSTVNQTMLKGIQKYLDNFTLNLSDVYDWKFSSNVDEAVRDFQKNIQMGKLQEAMKNLAFLKSQDFSLTPGDASAQRNKNFNKQFKGEITDSQLKQLRQFQQVFSLMEKIIGVNKNYQVQLADIQDKRQKLIDLSQKHYKTVLDSMDEERAIQKALIQGDYARARQLKLEAELKKQGVLRDPNAMTDINIRQSNSQSLSLYQALKEQSQSLLDKVVDPNDKQYATDRRIKDLQKHIGRSLTTSERWDVEDLVDLQFQLKELKRDTKSIKYGQIKTNEMSARGGFAGGVYVPQQDYAKITASNAQQQTALIQQIRGYMANLSQTINTIP